MIPLTEEDIRNYTLETVLVTVDMAHRLGLDRGNALTQIKENVDILVEIPGDTEEDLSAYTAALHMLCAAALAHWEELLRTAMKRGLQLADSSVFTDLLGNRDNWKALEK